VIKFVKRRTMVKNTEKAFLVMEAVLFLSSVTFATMYVAGVAGRYGIVVTVVSFAGTYYLIKRRMRLLDEWKKSQS
jgi:hypothetical protein